MIVDDSMIARAVLSRMVEGDGGFEIAAVAGTAEDAIAALHQVRVDIVILDLEMPGAGGLKSIPRILAAAGGAKVMIVSSLAEEGAEQTIAALALGAADTLPKPGTGRFNGRFSEILLSKLKALGYASAPTELRAGSSSLLPLRPMAADPIEILAIGASTGGIHALAALFQALPRRIGVPILVTQHLPPPFMPVFARQLAVAAHRPASVAEDGMILAADEILLAPGDAHLTLDVSGDDVVVHLSDGRPSSGCMPSVDPMLASVGAVYGERALGVVLTGMGRDGVEGASRLVSRGGSVIVQDEGSCAVWGMPRAILDAGLACAALPPDKIARRIAARTEEQSCK
ncbi:chemotaxis-specific protein-glutamate methyltransferase CheB [Sphingomonas sp.]|uniref:chemotaxis-specific protein-glutamate methyltransferase CheB n=1 Tax=Sphingomonas sp. TaxID=28214 RepID=UPI0025DA912E|nr:chemotaxis-specific protein-glutamate methyltransferase CheB [Sphingomonas sp.]MBV9529141.1 chemotaxis-specific protein-glutamate methyltransferase CheB [Sphingomonas sp.]